VREDWRVATLRSQLVSLSERALDDAVDVLPVATATGPGRECWSFEIAGRTSGVVHLKLVTVSVRDVHDSHTGAGLGLSDVDLVVGKIEVALVELAQLADAEASKPERGDDRAPWSTGSGLVFAASVEIERRAHRHPGP
jgi:hypothetical protein